MRSDEIGERVPPEGLFAVGAVSQYVGAAIAVGLFDDIDAPGVALLRVLGAALIVIAVRRPWRRAWTHIELAWTSAFGIALAGMNLFFYLAISGLTLSAVWWYVRSKDRSRSMTVLSVPREVDSYEIAYLRGGVNEVTRVTIVSLAERGFLGITPGQSSGSANADKRISCQGVRPGEDVLSDMERAV